MQAYLLSLLLSFANVFYKNMSRMNISVSVAVATQIVSHYTRGILQ